EVGAHPTGVATAKGVILAADSNDATLAFALPGKSTAKLIGLALVGRRSDAPNDVVLSRDGKTAYVSLGADDAVAVMKRRDTHAAASTCRSPRHERARGHRQRTRSRGRLRIAAQGTCKAAPRTQTTWKLAGLIPTGWYPTAL